MRVTGNRETSQKAMAIFYMRADEGSATGDGSEGTYLNTTSMSKEGLGH